MANAVAIAYEAHCSGSNSRTLLALRVEYTVGIASCPRLGTAAPSPVCALHTLGARSKRCVVGVTLRRAFDAKERAGQHKPLLFVVLDELNK